jgi:hypothetical protein
MSIPPILLNNTQSSATDSADFTTTFRDPLDLRDAKYEIALISAKIYNSYYNVQTGVNDTFQYYNNSTLRTITYPPGNYTLPQMNTEMHRQMKILGDFTVVSGVDIFSISIEPNYSTLKTRLVVESGSGYYFDLTGATTPRDLWGFNSGTYNSTTEGQSVANLNNNISAWYLNIDCINSSYLNGSASNAIYDVTPRSSPGFQFEIEPNTPLYIPISKQLIHKIRVWITTQDGSTPIYLQNEPTSFLFHIRRAKYEETDLKQK